MNILFRSSTDFALMMVEAIAVGIIISGGMWLISSIVLMLFERFGK